MNASKSERVLRVLNQEPIVYQTKQYVSSAKDPNIPRPPSTKGHPDWQLPEGKNWELTSYDWNEKTGYAKFQYTHKYTGELRSVTRWQPQYMIVAAPAVTESKQRPHGSGGSGGGRKGKKS